MLNAMTKLEIVIPIVDKDTQFVRDVFGTLKHGRTTSASLAQHKKRASQPRMSPLFESSAGQRATNSAEISCVSPGLIRRTLD